MAPLFGGGSDDGGPRSAADARPRAWSASAAARSARAGRADPPDGGTAAPPSRSPTSRRRRRRAVADSEPAARAGRAGAGARARAASPTEPEPVAAPSPSPSRSRSAPSRPTERRAATRAPRRRSVSAPAPSPPAGRREPRADGDAPRPSEPARPRPARDAGSATRRPTQPFVPVAAPPATRRTVSLPRPQTDTDGGTRRRSAPSASAAAAAAAATAATRPSPALRVPAVPHARRPSRGAAGCGASSPCSRSARVAAARSPSCSSSPCTATATATVAVAVPPGATAAQIGDLLGARRRRPRSSSPARAAGRQARASCAPAASRCKRGMPYGAALDRADDAAAAAPIIDVTLPEGPSRARGGAAASEQAGLKGSYLAATRARRRLDPRDYGAPRSTTHARGLPVPRRPTSCAPARRPPAGSSTASSTRSRRTSPVDMRTARRKNLSRYDVLIIASMIEREALVPRDRRADLGGHLQPPQAGHPARHRRHAALRAGQLDAAAAQSELQQRLGLQHAHAPRPAADADRQPGPGVDPGGGEPGERAVPLLRRQAVRQRRARLLLDRRAVPAGRRGLQPQAREARRQGPVALLSPLMRLGVLGWPVAHSRSPAMHNAALRALGLDATGATSACRSPPELFAETVAAPAGARASSAPTSRSRTRRPRSRWPTRPPPPRARSARRTRSPSARTARIRADNTDAPGLLAALRRPARRARALVLGAGGSARAVAYALREAGAAVAVWNRTPERAGALAADLGVARGRPRRSRPTCSSTARLSGLHARPRRSRSSRWTPMTLGEYACVVDLVYRAGGTELLRQARAPGLPVVDGLEILVRQGALSFQIWTGRAAPLDVMRRAARAGCSSLPNLAHLRPVADADRDDPAASRAGAPDGDHPARGSATPAARFLTDVIVELGLRRPRARRSGRRGGPRGGDHARGGPARLGRDHGDQLARAIAERTGLDHLDLSVFQVDMAAANLLSSRRGQALRGGPGHVRRRALAASSRWPTRRTSSRSTTSR